MLGSLIKHPDEQYPFVIDYNDRLPSVFVASATYTATTISVNGDTETYTDSANGIPAALVGDQCTVSGAANAANNGVFEVVNRTAGLLSIAAGNLVTEASGASITMAIATPAKVLSGVLSAIRESAGLDVSTTFLASTAGTIFDNGKKMGLVFSSSIDGENYIITMRANLNTGVGHNFTDTLLVFSRARSDR